MSEFAQQLSAATARRMLADLEARTEGRPMTRSESRRAARYRDRITHDVPAGTGAVTAPPADHEGALRWTS